MAKNKFSHHDYEIVKREILSEGFFRLVRNHLRHKLFNGQWGEISSFEVMERTSAVAILPYDPVLDRIVLIEQFRPGALANPSSPWLIEIIAGCIEVGETPAEVAQREAIEEAGCTIEVIHPIYDYFVSPSCMTEYMYLFCGKIDSANLGGSYGLEAENEDIYAYTVSTEEAFVMLRNNEIKTSPAIICLQWLQINKAWLQSSWQQSE